MNYASKIITILILAISFLSIANVAKSKKLSKTEFLKLDVNDAFIEKDKENFDKAFQIFFYHASENKNHEAQTEIGWMYHVGKHVDVDYKKAIYWYKKASEQGNGVAQSNLGLLYANGFGVKKNLNEAKKLFLEAAKNGELSAMVSLSHLYYNKSLEENDNLIKAYMWAHLAHKYNYSHASHNVKIIKNKLSTNQIKEAEKLANECEVKVFTNC